MPQIIPAGIKALQHIGIEVIFCSGKIEGRKRKGKNRLLIIQYQFRYGGNILFQQAGFISGQHRCIKQLKTGNIYRRYKRIGLYFFRIKTVKPIHPTKK